MTNSLLSAKKFAKLCQDFFNLFEIQFATESSRLTALRSILAELQSLVLKIDLVVERLNQPRLQKKISSCFSSLGLYRMLSSYNLDIGIEVLTGDAIDDILDIYNDLHEGHVRWMSGRKNDAAWHWRFSYDTHWGQHLVDLQRVLHENIMLINGVESMEI
jgi:hypothetical protein